MDSRSAIDFESLFNWNRGERWAEEKSPFEHACSKLQAAQASHPDPAIQWQLSLAFCTFLRNFIEHSRDDGLRMKTIEDLAACDLDRLLALPPGGDDELSRRLAGQKAFLSSAVDEHLSTVALENTSDTALVAQASIDAPDVSVIIGSYNTQDYVGETLESLLDQDFANFEIICIDDGSTDDSLRVLEEFAARDSRITIVRQNNQGVSRARNVGTELARGQYLYYMDSDDLLERSALRKMLDVAKQNDLDVVYIDGCAFYDSEDLRNTYPRFEAAYDRRLDYGILNNGADLVAALYRNGDDYVPTWLAMYRKSFLESHSVRFIEHVLHEDNAFFFVTGVLSKRSGHCHEKLLRCRVRSNSIMTQPTTFSNAYGYYACSLEMFRTYFSIDKDLSPATRSALKAFIFRTLRNSAAALEKIPESEWGAVFGLPEDSFSVKYAALIPAAASLGRARCSAKVDEFRSQLQASRKSGEEKDRQIDRLETERDDIREELRKTKLALESRLKEITAQRDAALNEVARIRQSKSFKVGNALMRPFIALKRGMSKR